MNTTTSQASPSGDATVDVVVLGVGTCGEDLALRLLGAGLSVVGIEAELVGGECAYWACLPSKMMIRAANLLQEARRVDGAAGRVDVSSDWAPVATRVRTEAAGGWRDTIAVRRFEDRGGQVIHGRGRLAGPRSVSVGSRTFTARHGIVIATGSRPAVPSIPGLDSVPYWTTHDVISAVELPRSLVIIGGGAVGCELGQVLARFGVDVTIVEGGARLLAGEEPEASRVIEAAFEAEGMHVLTGSVVERVASEDRSIVVTLAGGRRLAAERLLIATGRRVDLNGLGLDVAGLDPTARSIAVDDRMRAADGIWAMGDVTGKAMFTHVALYQSAIVAAELLGLEHPPASYHAVPRVTFTDPEVGSVGMTEADARAAGHDVVVIVKKLPATFRGWLHAARHGVTKVVADRRTGVVLGATTVGPHGGDVIGMLTLAVHAGIPLSTLRSMIYAFPTFHGGVGEAIGAYGRGLSTVIDPGYDGFAALDAIATSSPRA